MDLVKYVELNVRHYCKKAYQVADNLLIEGFAKRQFQLMRVPNWNDSVAQGLRKPTSILSRLLAMNSSATQDAERILDGKVRLFGRQIATKGGFPDWSQDYISGHRYSVKPIGRYKDEAHHGADMICPWEISRLQFIPTLISAHRRQSTSEYSDHFFRLVAHWSLANPFLFGVNWLCGLDVAIRALNIALGIVHFGKAGDAGTSECIRLLWAHLVYLQERDLYQHKTVVNNHQLVASILHYALLHLFDGEQAVVWRKQAREVVATEVTRQFRPDGGNIESALLYHQFVLESLYVAVALLAHDEAEECFGEAGKFPSIVRDRIWKASRFSADYMRCWSGVPQVGDSSDGRILYHREYFSWKPADGSYLADWGALVFPHDDPFADSGGPTAKIHSDSGVGTFVGDRYCAIFFAMPVSAGAAGHNHLDKASFILRVGERPVFVDSGTFCYTSDPAERNLHRSGRAHNVLLFAGHDQAIFSGPETFDVPLFNDVGMQLLCGESNEPTFDMWHDGFSRLVDAALLSRTVHCFDAGIKCRDTVAGSGRYRVELVFNLSPGLTCEVIQGTVLVSASGMLLCTVIPPSGWMTTTESAWYSASYADRQASTRLVFSATVDLPFEALTEVHIA